MRKVFSKRRAVILCFILMILIVGITIFPQSSAVAGETVNDERSGVSLRENVDFAYIENEKEMLNFANTFNDANYGDTIFDIQRVIPIEYLRHKGENAVYKYFGEEYGFLVVHTTHVVPPNNKKLNYIHIFIVNFKWEYLYNQQSLTIKPLITGDLEYEIGDNGAEVWKKSKAEYNYYHGNNVTTYRFNMDFHLTNVGFGAQLLNENELNYGDSGYNKQRDNGLIILQTRLNYSGIKKKSNDEGWFELTKFSAHQLIGALPIMGDIFDFFEAGMDFANVLETFSQNSEQIECNNEKDIFTEKSKEMQMTDNSLPSYTRAVYISPKEEIFVDKDGYAQCITLLNDTDRRSRLIQQVEFEIVSTVNGTNLTYYSDKNENGEDVRFRVTNNKILFDTEDSIVHECYSDIPIYLLPNGDMSIDAIARRSGQHSFEIKRSGKYDLGLINLDNGRGVPITRNADNRFVAELNAGEHYRVKISQEGLRTTNNTSLRIELVASELLTDREDTFNVEAYKTKNYFISSEKTANYVIRLATSGATVLKVWKYGETENRIDTNRKTAEILIEGGSSYFVSIVNQSGGSINGSVRISAGNSLTSDSQEQITLEGYETKYYGFKPKLSGEYTFTVANGDVEIKVFDKSAKEYKNLEFLSSENYFISVRNTKNVVKTAKLNIYFGSGDVGFGNNTVTSKYVKFIPKATESYRISVGNGAIVIYDSSFNELYSNIASSVVNLREGNTYYFKVSNMPCNINITLDSTQVDKFNEEIAKTADTYGNAYYTLDISIGDNYRLVSNGTIYLFDNNINLQQSGNSSIERKLAVGKYIVKIAVGKNANSKLTVLFMPGGIEVGSSLNVTKTGESYFRFVPLYTEKYKFYIRGNNNNTHTGQIILYDSNLKERSRSSSAKYVDLTADLSANTVYYLKLVLNNMSNQSIIFNAIYMSGNHINDSEQMELFDGQAAKRVEMNQGKKVALKFVPKKSTAYNLYIEQEIDDNYSVELFDGTSYVAKLTPTIMRDGRIHKYSYSLDSGKEYYFIVTGESVYNMDTVYFQITERYDSIKLIAYSGNDTADRVEDSGIVIPTMRYSISLVSGLNVIDVDFSKISVKKGSQYIEFYGSSFVVKSSAIDQQIEFMLEYYYVTYFLNLNVKVVFETDAYNIDLETYETHDLIPRFTARLNSQYKLTAITADFMFRFFNNNNIEINNAPIKNVALNGKQIYASYDYKTYSYERLKRMSVGITLKGNGYEYVLRETFNFYLCESNVTMSNFNNAEKTQFMYVDATADEASSRFGPSYTINVPSIVKVIVINGNRDRSYDVSISAGGTKLLICRNLNAIVHAGGTYVRFEGGRSVLRSYGDIYVTGYNEHNNGLIYGSDYSVIVKEGTLKIGDIGKIIDGDGFKGNCIWADNLALIGKVEIRAGAPLLKISDLWRSNRGSDAIYVTNFIYIDCTGIIVGGQGKAGTDGSTGKRGADGKNGPSGSIFKPVNGDDGKSGWTGGSGGDGGDGGYAIYVYSGKRFSCDTTDLRLIGGAGGKGGTGGTGGAGGNGHDDDNADPFTGAGDPGKGGSGGTGGRGGKGGNGQFAVNVDSSLGIRGVGGAGGDGGTGGRGGNGGDAGATGKDGAKGIGGAGGAGGQGGIGSTNGRTGAVGNRGSNGSGS